MADKSMKGITIEFGAEIQKLTTALNKINGQSRDLQSELKRVEKLLQFDPENTELLAQKQEILSEAIQETEKRVDSLRQVGEQMQDKLNRNKITTQQFRDMQREIVKAEQDLNKLRQSANSLNTVEQAADEAGNALKGFGDEARNSQEQAEALSETVKRFAAGAAGIGAVVESLKVSDEITDSMNQFRAATGATKEEADTMRQSMEVIYEDNLGESFSDIAESMALIQQRTKQTGEELEVTTRAAITIRDTFQIDVIESIRGADALMRHFGMTAEQAYTYIANGAQQGLNQNQDLADQIAEYAVYYEDLGLSAEDMFQMMAAGAESGAYQIDYLNDAMKEFGIRAKDNSDSTRQAFADLGFEDLTKEFAAGGEQSREAFRMIVSELSNMDDQVKQNEIGIALFGTKWEDLGIDAMKALTNANSSLSFTKTSLESLNEIRYDSLGNALEGVHRQILTGIVAPLGEQATPAVTLFSQGLQVAIEHADQLAPVAAAGASAVVAFTVTTNAHTAATTAASTATKALNLAMSANPAAKVVTVVAALTGALVTAYQTNETFRAGVNQTWNSFKDGVTTVYDGATAIKNTVVTTFAELPGLMVETGKNTVQGLVSGITNGVANVMQAVDQVGGSVIGAFKNKLGIHSPSIVFRGLGNNVIEGLNIGIGEKAELAISQIRSLGDDIIGTESEINAQLNEGKQLALAEEMDFKQAQLDLQRESELEYLNRVLELIQAQVEQKRELEELHTQVKEKEEQLQSDAVSVETKKQVQIDLDGLRQREKNLQQSLNNGKLQMQAFIPTLQSIAMQYGQVFSQGFQSTEGEIMAYINRLAAQMRAAIERARAAANVSSDGSHATGLSYVPFDGYRAILHEGEAVLTKAENRAYREQQTGNGGNISVVQNFYDAQNNPVKQQRQAARELRRLKRVMA